MAQASGEKESNPESSGVFVYLLITSSALILFRTSKRYGSDAKPTRYEARAVTSPKLGAEVPSGFPLALYPYTLVIQVPIVS